MAHDWTRKAQELETMTLRDFAVRFGAELADVAAGYPDRPPGQICPMRSTCIADMGRRSIAWPSPPSPNWPTTSSEGTFPLARSGGHPAFGRASDAGDGRRRWPAARTNAWMSAAAIFPLRLVFDPPPALIFTSRDLGEFRGAHLGLVGQLRPYLEEDVEAELSAAGASVRCPRETGRQEGTVRQHAKRAGTSSPSSTRSSKAAGPTATS